MQKKSAYLLNRASTPSCVGSLRHCARGFLLAAAVVLSVVMGGTVDAEPMVQAKRTPKILFETTAIIVEDVTPRARVILFGIERKVEGYSTRTGEVSLSAESDQRGVARFDFQQSVQPRSVYAAVDGVSGDFALASPEGAPVNVRPAQSLRMKHKAGQEFDAFDLDSLWTEAICIRPGHGAWRLSLMDGSSADENANAGTLEMRSGHMKAIGGAVASPGKFRPHDVLIAIEPYTLAVVATTVNE